MAEQDNANAPILGFLGFPAQACRAEPYKARVLSLSTPFSNLCICGTTLALPVTVSSDLAVCEAKPHRGEPSLSSLGPNQAHGLVPPAAIQAVHL